MTKTQTKLQFMFWSQELDHPNRLQSKRWIWTQAIASQPKWYLSRASIKNWFNQSSKSWRKDQSRNDLGLVANRQWRTGEAGRKIHSSPHRLKGADQLLPQQARVRFQWTKDRLAWELINLWKLLGHFSRTMNLAHSKSSQQSKLLGRAGLL